MTTQMVLIFVYGVYLLVMGILVGGFVVQNTDEIDRLNWWQRIILALLFVFWPIALLIGMLIPKESDNE